MDVTQRNNLLTVLIIDKDKTNIDGVLYRDLVYW